MHRLHRAWSSLGLAAISWLIGPPAAFPSAGPAEGASAPLRIPRVRRPPTIKDFLAGAPREAELRISDFRQFSPGDGAPVSQPTFAYLSYDDNNLYVVFVCKDDPSKVRARIARREAIMTDDRITISLDTFHDHRRAYWFDVNPYGVQADGNVTDGVEDDTSWDSLWHSEAQFTADGYIVLAAIPFKSVRFPSDESQTWGLVLGRFIQRNNELACWPHVSKSRPGWVQQGGDIAGFANISKGRNVQLIPYGLFAGSRFLDTPPSGPAQFRSHTDARAGLDAKMVLRDSFTLDVALNPDFSQVESDEPQVTVNQRYEVFFPEKRPFFIENAGLFKTPQTLFFSRRIVDPQFGARFSGKAGRWALGALAVDDRAPGKQAAENDPRRGDHAMNGVFRVQREFFKDSSAGALVTSREFASSFNRVYAFDTRLKLRPNWTFTGQAMSSETRGLDGCRLAGPAYYSELRRAGRHFTSATSYTDRSPGFRSDLGFITRSDIREVNQGLGYRWRPEAGPLVSFGPRFEASVNWRRDGRVQDWSLAPEFVVELPRMTEIAVEHHQLFELFADYGFRKRHNSAELHTEWLKWLAITAEFRSGSSVNYYPGGGLRPFLANMVSGNVGFTIRPSARTRIDQTYLHSSLASGGDRMAPGASTPASIFDNHILRSKVNYQFSRELSLRTIVDYNAVLSNPALIKLDRTKHVGLDVLLSYILNPGTALHVGYTDLYDNLALDPMVNPNLRRTGFPDLNTGRQLFVKFSYLLRM
jgi:hypothetical protein